MKHHPLPTLVHLAAVGLAAVLATSASSPQAAVVRAATSVTPSSTFGFYEAGLLINQSGLSVAYTSGVSEFDNYLSQGPLHAAAGLNTWVAEFGEITPALVFDLGAVHQVQGMALWNADYNSSAMSDILGSVDGIGFVPLFDNLALDLPGSGNDATAQRVDWAGQAMRYVQLRLSCPPNESHCWLAEVVFNTNNNQVAEPGSLALVAMAALAALGSLRSSSGGRKRQA